MMAINVCTPGHVDIADSYGLIAAQLARHLTALGAYVNLLPLGYRVMASQPPDVAAIAAQPIKAATGMIALGYPTAHRTYPPIAQHGPRVAITMFESTILPAGWREALNRCDAVIVPSVFCQNVFRACGVTVPVHVVALGVGDVYKPAQRPTDRPFTFLAFLDRGRRKGGMTALQAFLTAFGDDPSYRLILKSRKPKVTMELLNPNVEVIQRDMSEQELYELFCSADVLIDANKGEGFGLLGRQMAATGGVSLSTDWGGTHDDLDLWGVALPYKLVPADWSGVQKFEGQDLGLWAEPCVDEIAAIMRQVADNRAEYQRRALRVAPAVRRLYDWRDFAGQVLNVWKGATNGADDCYSAAS